MEFHLSLNLHIPYFDNVDFYELVWKYDRLNKYKQETNSNNNIVS